VCKTTSSPGYQLEIKLQPEANLPLAERIDNLKEVRIRHVRAGEGAAPAVIRAEVRSIWQVEEFRPELQIKPLAERNILEEAQVRIPHAGIPQDIPS
jgi:hypothetical protein